MAWRVIAQELGDARLTLVGSGGTHRSIEDELKDTVRRDPLLADTVIFTGWVGDVGQYLQRADVYVFPSLEEGMSNALLEACAWHRVIVASDIPANRAVLGDDFPLLFRAGDTQDLIATLRRALTEPSLRADAVERVARRRSNWSAEVVVEQLENLILRSTRSRR